MSLLHWFLFSPLGQMPDKQFGEGRVDFTTQLEGVAILAAGVCVVAGYSASVSERDETQCSVPFLSSVWSRAPAHGVMLLTFRKGLPS